MQKVTPFLWFDGNAEEAATFYASVFKKSKVGKPVSGPDGKVMESVSFVVHCKDQKEVNYYREKLTSGGGQESMCGWLKDKYGLSWQVVPDVLPKLLRGPKAGNVMQAFMQMRKFDIAALERAAA